MKKTPIMELIDYFDDQMHMAPYAMIAETFKCVIDELKEYEQKEKAFAFDCFKAGKKYGIDYCMSVEDGMSAIRPDFNQFYSEYAEQHNK